MNATDPTSTTDPLLQVTANKPAWFDWAVTQPLASKRVDVEDCAIHYLQWENPRRPPARGLMFVHGGGAHANWWRFIAPFFVDNYRVAAIDLSGMGDSATRDRYSAELRAKEIRGVMQHAELGEKPFIVGHSFGGFMTTRFGVDFGDEIGGAVIADTPIRPPDDPPPGRNKRVFARTRTYPTFQEALERFRLMPQQPCDNDFIVEFIARHSLKETEGGWKWKFDPHAMGADRWQEPFAQHVQNMRCRRALIYAQNSAIVEAKHVTYISDLMGPDSPVIEIPAAHHHLMLDQPLAFVAALRALLETWHRTE